MAIMPAFIDTDINYLGPVEGKPTTYLGDVPPGAPQTFPVDKQRVRVEDARRRSAELSIETTGFVLREDSRGSAIDFTDSAAIESEYYALCADLIQRETKAREVIIFDHTIRSSENFAAEGDIAYAPVPDAHSDYTEQSGPGKAHEIAGPDRQAVIDAGAYAIVNAWRSIAGTVEEFPLAFCDAQSMRSSDFVAADIVFPNGRVGGVLVVRHRATHRWCYFPSMRQDEVVIFKSFDPRVAGAHRYGAHCAIDDPNSGPTAAPRQSIEIRALALFEV